MYIFFIACISFFSISHASSNFTIATPQEIENSSPRISPPSKNILKGGSMPNGEPDAGIMISPRTREAHAARALEFKILRDARACQRCEGRCIKVFVALLAAGVLTGVGLAIKSSLSSDQSNGSTSAVYLNNSSSSTGDGHTLGPVCLNVSDSRNITGQSWDVQMFLPNNTSGEKSLAIQTNLCPIEGATNSSSLIAYVQSKNPNATHICVSKTTQTNPCTQYSPQAKCKPIKTLLKRNYSRYQLKQPKGKRLCSTAYKKTVYYL